MKSPFIAAAVLLICVTFAQAAPPAASAPAAQPAAAVAFDAAALAKVVKEGSRLVQDADAPSGQAMELDKEIRLERYDLSALKPGWHRLTVRVRAEQLPHATQQLGFQLWNPANSPQAFRYSTTFAPQEFLPAGKYVDLTRDFRIGPMDVQYGMLLEGGWKGLRIAQVRIEPEAAALRLHERRDSG